MTGGEVVHAAAPGGAGPLCGATAGHVVVIGGSPMSAVAALTFGMDHVRGSGRTVCHECERIVIDAAAAGFRSAVARSLGRTE